MKDLAERVSRGRQAIALARQQGLDTAEWELHLITFVETAGREPDQHQGVTPWILWEWRRVSIPRWREILKVSAYSNNDSRREEYARWMLRDILLDPKYQEPQS